MFCITLWYSSIFAAVIKWCKTVLYSASTVIRYQFLPCNWFVPCDGFFGEASAVHVRGTKAGCCEPHEISVSFSVVDLTWMISVGVRLKWNPPLGARGIASHEPLQPAGAHNLFLLQANQLDEQLLYNCYCFAVVNNL